MLVVDALRMYLFVPEPWDRNTLKYGNQYLVTYFSAKR